jgi:hypothetical protein
MVVGIRRLFWPSIYKAQDRARLAHGLAYTTLTNFESRPYQIALPPVATWVSVLHGTFRAIGPFFWVGEVHVALDSN